MRVWIRTTPAFEPLHRQKWGLVRIGHDTRHDDAHVQLGTQRNDVRRVIRSVLNKVESGLPEAILAVCKHFVAARRANIQAMNLEG